MTQENRKLQRANNELKAELEMAQNKLEDL